MSAATPCPRAAMVMPTQSPMANEPRLTPSNCSTWTCSCSWMLVHFSPGLMMSTP